MICLNGSYLTMFLNLCIFYRFLIGLGLRIKTEDTWPSTIPPLVPEALNILTTTKKMKVLSNWWTPQEPCGRCTAEAGSSVVVETSVVVLETKEATVGLQPITRTLISFKFWAKLKRTKKGKTWLKISFKNCTAWSVFFVIFLPDFETIIPMLEQF